MKNQALRPFDHVVGDEHSISVASILIVDDDALFLAAVSRLLKKAGYNPVAVRNAKDAVQLLETQNFSLIVSDIKMPIMDGIDFLRRVRRYDLDIPVLLVTGDPSIKTASTAVELGAFRYLIKPVQARELTDCIRRALRMYKMAKLRRQALELMGNNRMLPTGDRKSLEIYFSRALETMWIAFQPIIIYQDKKVYAYEALVRTEEPSLKFPTAFLVAAERLNRLQDMSRLIRKKVAERMVHAPEHFRFFINLHSLDLNDEDLYSPNAPLSLVAKRIVLEITERASLDEVVGLSEKVKKLRAMGFQIAVDDLGAGYAGLSSFTQLDPEIIKLDMSLIHGIDREFKKQSVVRSMSQLSKQLGMIMIAEGVETERERDVLISLGCDLLQGFLFARPGKGFPTAIF